MFSVFATRFVVRRARPRLCSSRYLSSTTNKSPPPDGVTNGSYLKYSMMYHDSVAFLLSNQLRLPSHFVDGAKTPTQIAKDLNLSVRGASALLVTLCRMDVVQVLQDSDESVDDVVYELTPSAREYLSDRSSATCFSLPLSIP